MTVKSQRTVEEIQQVVRLEFDGLDTPAIARRLGLDEPKVAQHRASVLAQAYRIYVYEPQPDRAAIGYYAWELYQAYGMGPKQLSRILGRDATHIAQWLRAAELYKVQGLDISGISAEMEVRSDLVKLWLGKMRLTTEQLTGRGRGMSYVS